MDENTELKFYKQENEIMFLKVSLMVCFQIIIILLKQRQ